MNARFGRRTAAVLCAASLPLAALAPSASAAPTVTPAAVSSAVGPSATPPTSGLSARTVSAHQRAYRLLTTRAKVPQLRGTFAGRAVDLETGSWFYTKRSTVGLMSASTMKAVTGALALRAMGPAHQFPTTVVQGASSTEVVVKAGGDPLLTRADLRLLASRTARTLAQRYDGGGAPARLTISVRVDDSQFGPAKRGPAWDGHWANPVRAFLLDRQNSANSSAVVGAYVASRLATSLRSALASVAPSTSVSVSYAGSRSTGPSAAELGRVAGHRLDDSIRQMVWWSDSNIAEMLFRNTAVALGYPGTWGGARAAAMASLRALGVNLTNVHLADGSGLSRNNRVTAQLLVGVLRAAQNDSQPRMQHLKGLLMTAGKTGTLATRYGRFDTAPSRCARGLMWGKSGTIRGVITLTGYARGADGKLKVFAFLVNNRNAHYSQLTTRRYLDRLVATIVGCY